MLTNKSFTNGFVMLMITAGITLTACKNNQSSNEPVPSTHASTSNTTSNNNNTNADALPTFSIKDANGKVVNLKDAFKGKKILVNLWATWCPPCRAEMPSLQTLYSTTDSSKVAFVFLSMDDDFNKALQFVKDKKYTLPVYYPAQELPQLFNVEGIPTTFIFDANGKIIHQQVGMGDYTSPEIRQLLQ